MSEKMICPKCKSEHVKKNGTTATRMKTRRQKYVCQTCSYYWVDCDRLSKEFIRIGVFSDMHCGHVTGLTPIKWNSQTDEFYNFRTESWHWFKSVVKQIGLLDYAIFNGDLIDGKQHKNGGLELLVTDRNKQVEMAIEVIKEIGALKNIIVRGTPYHTGQTENFEDNIAHFIGCNIYDRFLGDIGGKVFDFRHKVGRSAIPHGRVAPLSRQVLWSRLREERNGVHADVIGRSHVHYAVSIEENGILAFTTPALQGYSQYGMQECDGETDYGFKQIDVYRDGRIVVTNFFKHFDSNKLVVDVL